MIRIMVKDPVAGTRTPAVVPEHAPMRTLIPELIKRLGKPLTDPRGNRISYTLQKSDPGGGLRLLGSGDTLSWAGVAEDEEMTLTYRIIPG
jgi:hypothetical protein